MDIELSNEAVRQYKRLNEPDLSRITAAIDKLEREPPEGDIKRLQGKDGYRVRLGRYRIIFDLEPDRVYIYKIVPRGKAYKE
ncbi:MAG: type II toxin-antitoxin system RelE/ParE family toxin [Treponema sp.]|jgi:mRNA interferase RelE/StbE|nr:type II toxin-antitoxin system RelE/ParE family toxin [Treponema sp.]